VDFGCCGWCPGFGSCGCSLDVSGVVRVCWDRCCFWALFLGSGFIRTLLYTACVRRGALHFFNKVASYLSKKKNIG
jgi:hypothetical protein